MTLQERLASVHQESVTLYLKRQQIEAQRQQLANLAAQTDQQLVAYDAQIALLEDMLKPEPA